MDDAKCKLTANGPHSVYILQEDYKKNYITQVLDHFKVLPLRC